MAAQRKTKKDAETLALQRQIGARLQARREFVGVQRQELADVLGITDGQLGHYETGTSEMSSTKVQKLAHVLGVPPGYFYGELDGDELDQEDRDTIRFMRGMPPEIRASARAAVKAMHDANGARQTTHGGKAE